MSAVMLVLTHAPATVPVEQMGCDANAPEEPSAGDVALAHPVARGPRCQ